MKLSTRTCLATFAALAALPLAATTARAQAFSFTGGLNGTTNNTTLGETFTVGASALSVSSLGIWDVFLDGLGEAHPVTIWDGGGTSVASATVPSGTTGTLIGQYRYTALGSPVTLLANTTYTIGAYYPTGNDAFPAKVPTGNITSASGVSYGAARSAGGNAFSTSDGAGVGNYVNANFLFTPSSSGTPEPGSLGLLVASGLSGAGFLLRKRWRR